MEMTAIDLYGGKSPVELPAYGVSEAAHYLQVPPATLRTWVRGRGYPTARGQKFSEPLIDLADATRCLLSFVNLVEVHVLAAIRRRKSKKRSVASNTDTPPENPTFFLDQSLGDKVVASALRREGLS